MSKFFKITEGEANIGKQQKSRKILFFGFSKKGITEKPLKISSIDEFVSIYGDDLSGFYTATQMKVYFDNLLGFEPETYFLRLSDGVAAYGQDTSQMEINATASYKGMASPGTYANGYTVTIYKASTTTEFSYIEVKDVNGETLEKMQDYDIDKLAERINLYSQYISLDFEELPSNLAAGTNITITLQNGTNGTYSDNQFDYAQNEMNLKKIFTVKPDIIAPIDGMTTPQTVLNIVPKLKETQSFLVKALPSGLNETGYEFWFNELKETKQSYVGLYESKYAKVYSPYVLQDVYLQPTTYVVASGYARVFFMDKKVSWSVPAGDRTYAVGIKEFVGEQDETVLDRITERFNINTIRYIDNVGWVVYTSRTTSTNDLYISIHVRTETNQVVRDLKVLNFSDRERIMSEKFMKNVYMNNYTYFKNLYEKGGIEDSIGFDEAVKIAVNKDEQNRRKLNLNISWIPPEHSEYVEISLNRNDGILQITE